MNQEQETYLSVAQAADLLGISQETIYKEIQSNNLNTRRQPRQQAAAQGHRPL